MALDRPALRKLIGTTIATDGDLDAFCLDYFPKIHARFTIGMDRVQKVTMILQLANLAELERCLRGVMDPPSGSSTSAAGSASDTIRVLFLASLPSSVAPLDLGVEIRKIRERIQSARHRDRIQMQSEWAVRPQDIRRALLEHSPHIVHFSGHGEIGELIVEDDEGAVQPLTMAALGELFGVLKDNIRVVLLNACYSRAQAEAISEHIDCVIGMKRPVGDKAAITFAATFYEAIGYGRSVQTAFDLAKNAILLERIPGHDIPELVVRAGATPADLRLIV
jgi:hypothetical protein